MDSEARRVFSAAAAAAAASAGGAAASAGGGGVVVAFTAAIHRAASRCLPSCSARAVSVRREGCSRSFRLTDEHVACLFMNDFRSATFALPTTATSDGATATSTLVSKSESESLYLIIPALLEAEAARARLLFCATGSRGRCV